MPNQVVSVKNPEGLVTTLKDRVLGHAVVATSVATASSVGAVSSLPGVYQAFTVPLVSATTRKIVYALLVEPSHNYVQRLAMGYLAEATAANLISTGMAPYALAAVSGTAVFTTLATISIACSAMQGVREAYKAYSVPSNIEQRLIIVDASKQKLKDESFITRPELEGILRDYQSNSCIRRTLSFFARPFNKSGEVASLEKYLAANPSMDFISLKDLSQAMAGNGKQYKYRLSALDDHHPIYKNVLSATDRVINKVLESSFLSSAERNKAYKILGLNPEEELTQTKVDKAFRKASLNYHPDREAGSNEKFQEAMQAKKVLSEHVIKLEREASVLRAASI
ncbi:J domain-containing protein [Legionella lytica]|uniref:J domain-containing protein n=1 Tax=Legionella lytica TaxID=96232 RepID=A0ABW8D5A3_9GAMM